MTQNLPEHMEPNTTQNQEDKGEDFTLTQPTVQPFRSMRSDTIDVVHGHKKSLAQMVVAAQKKKRERQKHVRAKTKEKLSTKRILLSTIILLALTGLIALIGVQVGNYLEDQKTRIVIDVPYMVFPNSQVELAIGGVERSGFVEAINTTLDARNAPKNALTHIYFTSKQPGEGGGWFGDDIGEVLPPEHILKLSGDTIPSYVVNSLGDAYMFGIYGVSANRFAPFLLLEINNYETAFAGMLAWEKNLENDLTILFKLRHSGVQSTFTDMLLSNTDTRHLETRQGETALLYSFLDKETLLITTSKEALAVILERYQNKGLYEAK